MTVTVYPFPRELNRGERGTFHVGRRHLTSTNPWTRSLRIQGPVDERWIATIRRPASDIDEWSLFEAFIAKMDGLGGFFTFYDPARPLPLGAAAGANGNNGPVTTSQWDDATNWDDGTQWKDGGSTGLVAAAALKGDPFLKIGGLVASQAVSLKAGDRFTIRLPGQIHGYLHQVIADVASDASGETLAPIRPRLRRDVGVGDVIDLEYAAGVFRLADDEQGVIERFAPTLGSGSMNMVEAFEVLEL